MPLLVLKEIDFTTVYVSYPGKHQKTPVRDFNACRGENQKTRKTAGTSPCGGLNVLWPLVAGGTGHDPGQFGEPWGVGLEWVSGSRKNRVDERVAGQNGVDEG